MLSIHNYYNYFEFKLDSLKINEYYSFEGSISNIYREFYSLLQNLFLDQNTIKSIKVIGNQWYWMYEINNISFNYSEHFFDVEEEEIYSYMFDINDHLTNGDAYIDSSNCYKSLEEFKILNEINNFLFYNTYAKKYFDNLISGSSTNVYFTPISFDFKSYYLNEEIKDIISNKALFQFMSNICFRLLSTDAYPVLSFKNFYNFYISSYDVIHSWAIPSVGIKVDACPGRISSFKILFSNKGFYYGQCSELCGFLHGFMPINIKIL